MQKENFGLNFEKILLSKENVYGLEALMESNQLTLDGVIKDALQLKAQLGLDWRYRAHFPEGFQNYTFGWNSPDETYRECESKGKLLYVSVDLEDNGCSRRCAHCFTMSGQIDVERGRVRNDDTQTKDRKRLDLKRLEEQIVAAKKELGLKSVRILGRGEPTESPALLGFIERMTQNDLCTVVFTRGHVIGNDAHAKAIFNRYGIDTGLKLAARLKELNTSIILGYSALNDTIHDGMTGIKRHAFHCRNGLKNLLDVGFADHYPTRLGIEAPMAKLNMYEFPVSYILFQCLGISPIFNSYMVTGRADQAFFDMHTPTLADRLLLHAEVIYYMRRLGITGKVGAYLGTKECHDVERGLYIPSSGDVRPCTGYESKESIRGDLNHETIIEIWNRVGDQGPQHICPPKINNGFPLEYEDLVESLVQEKSDFFERRFNHICRGLGLADSH